MWLKVLRRWLEPQTQFAEEHQVEELRARQEEWREVELRKAELTPWRLPPSC